VRVNFNYFISEAVFGYVLEAVDLVASQGWRLLPRYRLDPATGMWRHVDGQPEPPMSLDDVVYEHGTMGFAGHRHRAQEAALAGYLEQARAVLAESPGPVNDPERLEVGEDFEHLRWFWLPEEIAASD
jgi:hypothetical protein